MSGYRRGVETLRPDLFRIRVCGLLDTGVGAWVLRQVDARLRLVDDGHGRTRHVLVDLTAVTTATPRGLRVLRHGHDAARRRGVGFDLVGAAHLLPRLGPVEHALLARLGGFPDLVTAVATVASRTASHPVAAAQPVPAPPDTGVVIPAGPRTVCGWVGGPRYGAGDTRDHEYPGVEGKVSEHAGR